MCWQFGQIICPSTTWIYNRETEHVAHIGEIESRQLYYTNAMSNEAVQALRFAKHEMTLPTYLEQYVVKNFDQSLIVKRLRRVRSRIRQRCVTQTSCGLDECRPVDLGQQAFDENVVGFRLDELELHVLEDEREVVRCRLTGLGVACQQVMCEKPHRV